MRIQRTLTLSLFLALLLSTTSAGAVGNDDVDILVVFPEKLAPSKVHMVTDGEATRGLLVPFGAIVNNINLRKRSEELGAELDTTLQGYDRYSTLFQALVARFKQRSAAFALTESRQPSQYLLDKGIAPAAGAQGYDYVIEIDDKFSGLSMLNILATRTDDVAPVTMLAYQVYDVRKKERINKGLISANGLQKRPYREAVQDRELFVNTYGAIADNLANQLVGTLFRTDKLHAMAASVGRGNEVPEVSAVLKRFEKRFDYRFEVAKDWKRTPMNSKYVSVLEPRSDLRLTLGIRFEVDLLLPEFGQDVKTLDEYLSIWLGRVADMGLDTSTFVEFKDITVPDSYRAYIMNLAGTGRQIVLLRLLNEDMIELVSVVFLKDFDTLYSPNRTRIEQMIAAARLQMDDG
jgi:hypothetical protein